MVWSWSQQHSLSTKGIVVYRKNRVPCLINSPAPSTHDWLTAYEETRGNDCVSHDVVKKAYWAARTSNNCIAINSALMQVCQRKGSHIQVDCDDGSKALLPTDTCTLRTRAVTTKWVSKIVEPPCGMSLVPPSPDSETFHTFVVGLRQSDGVPIALDCSIAQFGIFGCTRDCAEGTEPYIALPLTSYLKRIAKRHRELTKPEQAGNSSCRDFVGCKTDAIVEKVLGQ